MPTEDWDSSRHARGVVKVGLERHGVVVLRGYSAGNHVGLLRVEWNRQERL